MSLSEHIRADRSGLVPLRRTGDVRAASTVGKTEPPDAPTITFERPVDTAERDSGDQLISQYRAAGAIAGPLVGPGGAQPVRYTPTLTADQRRGLGVIVLSVSATTVGFILWLLSPAHVPAVASPAGDPFALLGRTAFVLVVLVELIKLYQNLSLYLIALHARDPIPTMPTAHHRIAVLTTIVPSKEPIDIVERTLVAMLEIEYPGQLDVWLLDEGNSEEVRRMTARIGVLHYSRKGKPQFNTDHGPYRRKTKAGNYNAWRAEHEYAYDLVCQMDPDHVPLPHMLARTVGYFDDPDVGFVVAPQVYGNMSESFVARGAAQQQFVFSGMIERGANGLDAPLLIGTNHLYRVSAWQQIGGYQDSVTEDHLTGQRLLGTMRTGSGRRWRGVYTPDVIAIGQGPTSWADYFNQQKRWAYGIWEIKLRPSLRAGIALTWRQRLLFNLVQFYYPSVGAHLVLGGFATVVYLLLPAETATVDGVTWLAWWSLNIVAWFALWLWLRRFNLVAAERRGFGLSGIALTLFAGPVYVAAGVAALLRRPLTYAVTAKGALASRDTLRTFHLHLLWAGAWTALLLLGVLVGRESEPVAAWAALAVATGVLPPVIALITRRWRSA